MRIALKRGWISGRLSRSSGLVSAGLVRRSAIALAFGSCLIRPSATANTDAVPRAICNQCMGSVYGFMQRTCKLENASLRIKIEANITASAVLGFKLATPF